MQRTEQRRTDSLDYIQSMLRELREISQSQRYDILTYMIEMAYLECSDILRGQRPARMPNSLGKKLAQGRSNDLSSLTRQSN